ncbi:MAG: hypothetical protein HY459_03485 [Parcubacteria group bacterium]|nr:hypothetical protein [Parcubacteria group bacterium]
MIDRALLGAIERAFERNEPREFIRHSLISSGYSPQDVDEAINLITYRKQQAPQILPMLREKQSAVRKQFHLSLSKDIILISSLSLSLIAFIIFYLYIRPIQLSCNTLGLPELRKQILGLAVNCNQVNIVYVEAWIAMFTTLALITVLIYLIMKKKQA